MYCQYLDLDNTRKLSIFRLDANPFSNCYKCNFKNFRNFVVNLKS